MVRIFGELSKDCLVRLLSKDPLVQVSNLQSVLVLLPKHEILTCAGARAAGAAVGAVGLVLALLLCRSSLCHGDPLLC